MVQSIPLIVRGACPHDCPDTCAWQVTVQDGRATRLKGDADHPHTRGSLCAKVNHYLDRVYSDARVLHPLRRTGPKGSGTFEQVSWETALAEIAAGLTERIDRHGGTTVLPFSYMGTQGLLQGETPGSRFFGRIGASRLVRAVCASTGSAGVAQAIGTNVGLLPDEIRHSRFIILWGTNTIVTNVHLWPFIREAQAAGATVVVIDPATTRTARSADWHIQPLPGSDTALAMGLMHVIVRDGLQDADYLERHATGFTEFAARLDEFTPERVADICGVPPEEIERLAHAYASTPASCIRLLVGMEHRAFGAETFRTIAYLPVVTGAWRHRGGGLLFLTAGLHWGAMNTERLEREDLTPPGTRSVNMIQIGAALNDPDLDPPITAVIVHGANPVVTMPNQSLTIAGLSRDDVLTVVHEQFLTDTARYADYVLPATTQVENLDLMWSWGHDHIALNTPAIAPLGEAVPTTEFFRRLSAAVGLDDDDLYLTDDEMLDIALDSDQFRSMGITRERLERDGWAQLHSERGATPFSDGGFPTDDGRCAFVPPSMRPGAPAKARWPLHLITAKGSLHFLNSSYAHVAWHTKAEGELTVAIHPDDASARGIAHGDRVEVVNDRARVPAKAHVGDVRRGVVALPSGWARGAEGVSANALTPDGLSDAGGGGDFHDTFVDVAPAREEVRAPASR
ncbi:molybdopterin-containing oxidoreductase family protein [Microbacterium hominis]|uniref:Molybdopterin-dependent oxidoreductase n=1 Tax=Microbacterium hominis TaxID=162426 RepID=A0A7D4QCZ4_9MICO|nr:molybdopterin-dependent oxidoreductase [Microbacterium hominis]QKJ19717.1 molybdopterin-dependent oxidoreductase [Microbacterium hominis]